MEQLYWINVTDKRLFFLQREWVVGQVQYLAQYPDYYHFFIDPANRLWKSLRGNKKLKLSKPRGSVGLICMHIEHLPC
jgi:hypothetical protein